MKWYPDPKYGDTVASIGNIMEMHDKFMRSLVKMVYSDDMSDSMKVTGMQIALSNYYTKYLEEEE